MAGTHPHARVLLAGIQKDQETRLSILNEYKTAKKIIGGFKGMGGTERSHRRRALDMVRRRPCTVQEMAASLGVPLEELERTIRNLLEEKEVTRHVFVGLEYVCTGDITDKL